MDIFITIIQCLAASLGSFTALVSILLFTRLYWPAPALWFLKLYASALSPLLLFFGLLISTLGLATDANFISVIGIYNVIIFGLHIFCITKPPGASTNFEKAFGLHWEETISNELKNYFLKKRTVLELPAVPDPRMEQNISFATIPGGDRKLLCDIWQPPKDIAASGLALIYLHGGAWYFLDKDLGTRPFFRHLCSQGHLIMDVAYRLAPETDLMGMIHDVKRAIAWMKENAGVYGINTNRIVVGGSSAGGHLALMAAYTANDPKFTPKELEGKENCVHAVISFYGPCNLEAMYYHTNQHLTTRPLPGVPKKNSPTQMPRWIIKKMGSEYYRLSMDKGFENTNFAQLMGGHPDECPETYTLFSPIMHVHRGCPATLLIHGAHDVMAPVKTTYSLNAKLQENHVETVMHILPQTDHGFDLQLPKLSPSAHNAIFDVERFLALMV